MQSVGHGPAALAPAGLAVASIGPTSVGQRIFHARRFVAGFVLAAALLIAAAAFATAFAPSTFAADPPAPPIPPVATIAVAGRIHWAGQPVGFVDTSTGAPTHREWAFGDGSDGTHRERPEHTFSDAGAYTVTLTVENDAGSSVATVKVTILGAWAGGVQLYSVGIYSKQATMRLCVAASNQMIRNMVYGEQDHSTAAQMLYNAWGRAHNGYKTPAAAGVDPGGWQSMLRHFVDPGYRIFASYSYANTLKQAARAMRLTGRPVGVFVGHGRHAWVISGFTATADPAITNTFKVLTVSVEGPLFGIRPSINGYDPAPNVQMSVSRFAHYLRPFHDPYEPKAWRNRYVVVIP